MLDPSGPAEVVGLRTDEIGREAEMAHMGADRSAQGSISAVLAAGSGMTAAPTLSPSTRYFSGDDAGYPLARMAQRDLDAALQLLAERAQYITGAGGAAIALRRGGYNDMLCRASAGSIAPEFGALLSAEFGLSGESVRTRLPLRCDDAERDTRVNREGCRQLGIASVAVMPIVSDDEVLGVFELFSGRVNAFGERDLSTLQRLGDMVETAVRLARTAHGWRAEVMGEFVDEISDAEPGIEVEVETAMPVLQAPELQAPAPNVPPRPEVKEVITPADVPDTAVTEPAATEETPAKVAVRKPVLWSAAIQPAAPTAQSDESHVPPVLRNLRKCQACGFPVSEGRTLCVDCEEKQWSGHLGVSAAKVSRLSAPAAAVAAPAFGASKPAAGTLESISTDKAVAEDVVSQDRRQPAAQVQVIEKPALSPAPVSIVLSSVLNEESESSESMLPFLSRGVSSSESWFSANKYILGAIVAVAVVLAGIILLR